MNYYNNISNILPNSYIFFNLSDKTSVRSRSEAKNGRIGSETETKLQLSNRSKSLAKVGQREPSLRGSKSRSNSSDYKARSPCGDRVRERRALFLSLSSAERKLPFYGRPRMRRMALYRGPSTCRRRRFDRDSKYRFDRAEERIYSFIGFIIYLLFRGSFEWTGRRIKEGGRGGGRVAHSTLFSSIFQPLPSPLR